jgi:hypothetical protein
VPILVTVVTCVDNGASYELEQDNYKGRVNWHIRRALVDD